MAGFGVGTLGSGTFGVGGLVPTPADLVDTYDIFTSVDLVEVYDIRLAIDLEG